MKAKTNKLILLLVVLISYVSAYSQSGVQTVKTYYDVWKTKIRTSTQYVGGVINGTHKFYTEDGVLAVVENYTKGKLTKMTAYFGPGAIWCIANYGSDGKQKGLVQMYAYTPSNVRYLQVSAVADGKGGYSNFKIYDGPNKLIRAYNNDGTTQTYKEYENGKVVYDLTLKGNVLTASDGVSKIVNNEIVNYVSNNIKATKNGEVLHLTEVSGNTTVDIDKYITDKRNVGFKFDFIKKNQMSRTMTTVNYPYGIEVRYYKSGYGWQSENEIPLSTQWRYIFSYLINQYDGINGKYHKTRNGNVFADMDYVNNWAISGFTKYDNGQYYEKVDPETKNIFTYNENGNLSEIKGIGNGKDSLDYFVKRFTSENEYTTKWYKKATDEIVQTEFFKNGKRLSVIWPVDSVKIGNRLFRNIERKIELDSMDNSVIKESYFWDKTEYFVCSFPNDSTKITQTMYFNVTLKDGRSVRELIEGKTFINKVLRELIQKGYSGEVYAHFKYDANGVQTDDLESLKAKAEAEKKRKELEEARKKEEEQRKIREKEQKEENDRLQKMLEFMKQGRGQSNSTDGKIIRKRIW